ncbi:MAG TPA: hypothetical protein VF736_05925 [Pyrinomonadaceae bacterium]|jgi:hypothetical protein
MNNQSRRTRYLADLSCAFGPTPDAPRSGTITSIGLRECFVKTKATVMEGQDIYVRVWMPDNRWLRLSGRVKYHMSGVGFGVVFNEPPEAELAGLAGLVQALSRRQGDRDTDLSYDPAGVVPAGSGRP